MMVILELMRRIEWRKPRMKISMVRKRRNREERELVPFKTGKTCVTWLIKVPGIQ